MAPPKQRLLNHLQDDAQVDATGHILTNVGVSSRHDSTLTKPTATTTTTERRKQPSGQPAPTHSHTDTLVVAGNPAVPPIHEALEGVSWEHMPRHILQQYRSTHLLRTPSASGTYNSAVLSSRIGKKAPSCRHRQSQEALVSAVRRHFNNQAINEHEVIVNFLYTVKNNDKVFRHRFPPPR